MSLQLDRRRQIVGVVAVAALLGLFIWLVLPSADAGRARAEARATPTGIQQLGPAASPEPTPVRPLELPVSQETMQGYIATFSAGVSVRKEPALGALVLFVEAISFDAAPRSVAVVGVPPTVRERQDGWIQVLVPMRPNQQVGWVQANQVSITRTDLAIKIDQNKKELHVRRGLGEVFSAPISVGSVENPTPSGMSYITEVIANADPTGPYGPFAFGLALHSETLTEFNGGPGQVGIHGTNAASSIGQRASHGCIRLANEDIRRLAETGVPLGTPVFIGPIDSQAP